jgi:hypothetical protein
MQYANHNLFSLKKTWGYENYLMNLCENYHESHDFFVNLYLSHDRKSVKMNNIYVNHEDNVSLNCDGVKIFFEVDHTFREFPCDLEVQTRLESGIQPVMPDEMHQWNKS